ARYFRRSTGSFVFYGREFLHAGAEKRELLRRQCRKTLRVAAPPVLSTNDELGFGTCYTLADQHLIGKGEIKLKRHRREIASDRNQVSSLQAQRFQPTCADNLPISLHDLVNTGQRCRGLLRSRCDLSRSGRACR